jgi:hypothetical protein
MAVKDTKDATPGRCINCRAEVIVPNSFADGDTMQCSVCRVSLKITRGPAGLRLPIADVGPLRDEIKGIQSRIVGLESDLARARASFGVGANGFGIGVAYVVFEVALNNQNLSRPLFMQALGVGVVSGVALEAANFMFLAKRREMSRLSEEIKTAQSEVLQIQSKIRESLKK